jgi:hypothetical protein
MVDERIIVILSFPGGILLKEGTTLFFHKKDFTSNNNTSPIMNTGNSSDDDIIQLGIILEIFGPVGQPLYSVRLPLPPQKEKKLVTKETAESNQRSTIEDVMVAANVNVKDVAIESLSSNEKASNAQATAKEEHVVHEQDIIITSFTEEPVEHGQDIILTTEHKAASEALHNETDANDRQAVAVEEPMKPVVEIPPPQASIDPWCRNGEYTKILHSIPKLPVYYRNDLASANALDTEAVIRNSGRGCDASNLFDEEIVDVQDYSDDEQERMAKGNRNKKNHGTNTGSINNDPPQNREKRSTNLRNRGNPTTYQGSWVPHSNRAKHAVVPGSFMPPSILPSFHPTHATTTPASTLPMVGIGVPHYYPINPTGQYYATPYPMMVPMNPSYFVPPHQQQQGYHMSPPQLQQPPWYYYNGAYQSVPPPPPPPSNVPSTQHPPSAKGSQPDTVYYDFS